MKRKTFSKEYYEIKQPNSFYGLAETFNTYEEAIQAGEDMNKREIANGYKPTEWIVTRTELYREWYDGRFVTESKSTVALSK